MIVQARSREVSRPRSGAIGRLLCALGFHAWRDTSLAVISRPNMKIERCVRAECRKLR